ncbi:thrombomodulin [Mesocricetus auratus]|uniref:Thrombomodulin n=1 Tax=Mesocricetus auratus TaxID=10036 RepID=A0A1U7QHW5_MESAU|nr:thrombomodulin [Mesocricetus auratus]
MLGVLLLGVLVPAGLGITALTELQSRGSQCLHYECFALFQGPRNFLSASLGCESLKGHLMTVRSTVAAEVISLLLSDDSSVNSRPWIGLRLPQGCHDPEHLGILGGFQWVTGDNYTSYSRWVRPKDQATPLCGPLCVRVSTTTVGAPGEQAWEEQQCETEADSFLCEFHFRVSCGPLVVNTQDPEAAHFSSTYHTPFGARGADFENLPEGSFAIVESLGLELMCEARPETWDGHWTRQATGAWDCRVENGGCDYLCNQSMGEPRCLCPSNSDLLADGRSCTDVVVPEEPETCTDLCEHFCITDPDIPGSYACMCATGYRLAADKHQCEDVDDCRQGPNPCPQRCVNTKGGFACLCYDGFELVDGECVERLDPCFGNNCEYQCQPVNTTEYICICAEGFRPKPEEPHRCELFCNESSCPADCDPYAPDFCYCPEGFILDEGHICVDIDECSQGECSGSECRNLPGSYECNCGPDTALAGQVSKDCNPSPVIEYNEDHGSGEPPVSPTPGSPIGPPSAKPVHSGVLIGTSIASLSLVVALLVLLCHLRKKQGARAELEYKCASPAKEVVLQQVRTDRTLQKF